MQLQILVRATVAQIILKSFSVRVHVAIARFPWARLWYLARGFDPVGRGIVELPVPIICQLLAVSSPTLYEWLRDGRNAGAFRKYKVSGNRLHIILGGLPKVCLSLGLPGWGATATVALLEVNREIRAIATGIATADQQHKSHFAARRSLKNRERPFYTPPTADQILAEGERSSEKPERGQVPFLLWVGQSMAFVSKGFVPFGASQRSIGRELGIRSRTVRRHQQQLGLECRQIAQTKHAYKLLEIGIQWEADHCKAEPDIWYDQETDDSVRLYEPNGISSSRREGGHRISRQRFFTYAGKTWLYRCNIYGVSHYHINSMRCARRRYKKLMAKNGARRGGMAISNPDRCRDSEGFLKMGTKL